MTCGSWGKTRAYFDVEFDIKSHDNITIGTATVKGFKLIDAGNGLFIGMTSVKKDDGEYQNTVYLEKPLNDELLKLAENDHALGGVKSEPKKPVGDAESVEPTFDEDLPF